MMQKAKSSTMRIDLIPEISDVPLSAHPKQLIVPSRSGRGAVAAVVRTPTPSQQSYQELFQSVYDAGFITDLRGRVRDVNRRAVEFFGREPEAFRQLCVGDVVSGATEPLVRTLFENLQHERFTLMQAYCLRADGTSFPAEIAVSQMQLSVPHLCFFVRDVTVRRQAEEMLRTEHNALQNASDAIVVTDLEAQLEYVNPATARIWGYQSPVDLIGQSLGVLLADPADAHRIISTLVGETFQWKGEATGLRATGEPFRLQVSASCNRDSDGDVVGAVLSLSDLSALDRVADAQRDVERQRVALAEVSRQAALLAGRVEALLAISDDTLREHLAGVMAPVAAIRGAAESAQGA
jgi:PAS domain S-box-containing protein